MIYNGRLLYILYLLNLIYGNLTVETEIKNNLFNNYRRDIIPNNDTAINIKLGIMIRAINNINHMDGTFKLNIWLRYKWKDSRLVWNNKNIEWMTFTTDPTLDSSIWIPDIYLYNTAENPLKEISYTNAIVYNDGNIILSRPGIIISSCSFDLSYFPYDIQNCYIKMGSWSYANNKMYLTEFHPSIDISNYVVNEEWELDNYSTIINEKKYNCCPHKFGDITFYIRLIRKSDYYNENLVIPAFATASLMIFTMFIPWDSGERISFATTIMLSIVVFLLILSEHLPKTNKKPLLSTMFVSLMGYSLFGLLLTIIISYLHTNKTNRVGNIDNLEQIINQRNKFISSIERCFTMLFGLTLLILIIILFLIKVFKENLI